MNREIKNMTPHFEDSGRPVYALTDRKMLTRMIQNLVSNGIKYGSNRLDFTLAVDEAVHISVSNPISDNEIDTEKMFDQFYRANPSRTAGGAGIGLYICRQFVEAMDGGVSASVGDGVLTVAIKLGVGDGDV